MYSSKWKISVIFATHCLLWYQYWLEPVIMETDQLNLNCFPIELIPMKDSKHGGQFSKLTFPNTSRFQHIFLVICINVLCWFFFFFFSINIPLLANWIVGFSQHFNKGFYLLPFILFLFVLSSLLSFPKQVYLNNNQRNTQ